MIRYEGKGPELLLIPGVFSPAITSGFVAERLAEAFNVHVLDVRGRGLSETGDLDNTLDSMAADAVALAEQMDRPIVMGHAMGARTSIRAVATRHETFKGAILVDPPVSGPNRRHYPSAWQWYGDSIKMAVNDSSAEYMKAYCPTWTEDQRAPGRMAAHLPLGRDPHLL